MNYVVLEDIMKSSFNKDKLITISILPLMWLAYFFFELFTGRIINLYDIILNLSLIVPFMFTGWIIYSASNKYSAGFKAKALFTIFLILMIFDQGIKLIIKFTCFDSFIEIIPKFLFFNPIINTHGSWLNARFDLTANFPMLILLNAIFLFFLVEMYRYGKTKGHNNFWMDMGFVFILSGALCSLIDKMFYGGSLDFIGISNLFIADIKDLYINLGLLFFIMFIYKSDYLKEDDISFKDDLIAIKNFLAFIKTDIIKKKKKR